MTSPCTVRNDDGGRSGFRRRGDANGRGWSEKSSPTATTFLLPDSTCSWLFEEIKKAPILRNAWLPMTPSSKLSRILGAARGEPSWINNLTKEENFSKHVAAGKLLFSSSHLGSVEGCHAWSILCNSWTVHLHDLFEKPIVRQYISFDVNVCPPNSCMNRHDVPFASSKYEIPTFELELRRTNIRKVMTWSVVHIRPSTRQDFFSPSLSPHWRLLQFPRSLSSNTRLFGIFYVYRNITSYKAWCYRLAFLNFQMSTWDIYSLMWDFSTRSWTSTGNIGTSKTSRIGRTGQCWRT